MPQVETSDPQKNAQNTALFIECVSLYAQQAMIAMGKIVNPITRKAERNLDAARLFIDMLEMLEAKTKGNLSREEERLLQSSLGGLRLTYVEEANAAPTEATPKEDAEAKTEGAQTATPPPPESQPKSTPPTDEDTRKRFTKKYE